MWNFFTRQSLLKKTLMIIGGVILAAGLAFLFGFVVLHLWNWLMPELFGLKEITYLQAWGLVLLSHILFKSGSSSGGGGHHSKRKRGHRMGRCNPEGGQRWRDQETESKPESRSLDNKDIDTESKED